MVTRGNVPEEKGPDEKGRTDQRILRTLLKRSGYATSDLQAVAGPDQGREDRMIDQINDSMIMAEAYPASQRQLLSADRAALSRWEDEGGSLCLSINPKMQGMEASENDNVR